MQDPTDTPYARLGLDPWSSPEDLTEALRELAEEADPEERARLQAWWRELTLHPDPRLDAAFFAHPGRRPGSAPRPQAVPAVHDPLGDGLDPAELVVLPPLRLGLGEAAAAALDPLDADELLRR